MDKIIVKSVADILRVADWASELHGLAVELPFTEGELISEEELNMIRFREVAPGMVDMELWIHATEDAPYKKLVSWLYDLRNGTVTEVRIEGTGEQKMILGMAIAKEDVVGISVRKFRAVMLFAAYYREEVQRTKRVSRTGGGGNGKRKRKPLTLRTYTLSGDMLRELPPPKKLWKGYQESFGVRGHYRRYQSGKVIWVRPYEKKGRLEKKSDREYVL